MRVTKTIREYIEECVRAKFPVAEIEKQVEENRKIVKQANEEINKLIAEASKKIVLEVGKKFGITKDMAINQSFLSLYSSYSYSTSNAPDTMKANAERVKREKEIADAIKNIVVTLELDGNKEDLEKMLAEI